MTKEEFKAFTDRSVMQGFLPDDEEYYNNLQSVISEAISEHEAEKWKPYPENKPVNDEMYIVTGPDDDGNNSIGIGFYENAWYSVDGQKVDDSEVIAFRELPAPYQPEGREQDA